MAHDYTLSSTSNTWMVDGDTRAIDGYTQMSIDGTQTVGGDTLTVDG
jgi:hypothetical protein